MLWREGSRVEGGGDVGTDDLRVPRRRRRRSSRPGDPESGAWRVSGPAASGANAGRGTLPDGSGPHDSVDPAPDLASEVRSVRDLLARATGRLDDLEGRAHAEAAKLRRFEEGAAADGVSTADLGSMATNRERSDRGSRGDRSRRDSGVAIDLAQALDRWQPTPSGALLVTMAAVALSVLIAGVGFVAGLALSASLSAPSRTLWIGGLALLVGAVFRGLLHLKRIRARVGSGDARYRTYVVDAGLAVLLLAALAMWLVGVRA